MDVDNLSTSFYFLKNLVYKLIYFIYNGSRVGEGYAIFSANEDIDWLLDQRGVN